MTEILFSEKHSAESVRHGCKHTQCGENSTDSRAAQRKTAVCCAVSFALRTPSGRGQALTPEFTRGERFFVAVQQNVMCYI